MRQFTPDISYYLDCANPYSNPKACGLTIVDSMDDPEVDYSFSIVLVVRDDETGKLFIAHDSGCSCPSPFETVHGLDDMTELTSVEQLRSFIAGVGTQYVQSDIQAMVEKVEQALGV